MRTQARIATFNLIYMNFFEEVNDEAFSAVFESENLSEKGCEFAKELFNAFFQNKLEIEDLIKNNVIGYEFDRIYKTDLALLFLGIAEIKFIKTPKPVVIDEVLKIAKQYSTEKSHSFLNGVLAKIEE